METRATVIIPTFGDAKFAQWAIRSVRDQTVADIEICIICDGSPDHMVSFFKSMEKEDHRIKIFTFPKSPRTGEPYRDIVIKQTTGKNIFYCSHDDLWLPDHVQELENSLFKYRFTHSLPTCVLVPENMIEEFHFPISVGWFDLTKKKNRRKLLKGHDYFPLSFGGHTRQCYAELDEGWVTTPGKDIATDVYMWRKFVSANPDQCLTTMKVTALKFPYPLRKNWSEDKRDAELKFYYGKIHDPDFIRMIDGYTDGVCPPHFQVILRNGLSKWRESKSSVSKVWEVYKADGFFVLLKKIKDALSI